MEFTTSVEEMLKIYNWGDPEVLRYTGLSNRRAGIIQQDYKQILARGGTFIDPAFPHEEQSVGALEDIFDDAQGRQALNNIIKDGFNEREGYTWVRLKNFIHLNDQGQISKNLTPVFSTGPVMDSFSRADIAQGTVGNCWFLAALGAISVNKEQFEFCVPADNYYNETGVYHFRFWYQGLYVDVVVDDYIPVFRQCVDGIEFHKTVGSWPVLNGNKLEFWAPLVEKAYAKLFGSYKEIAGGWPANGFENITGGIPEMFLLGRQTPRDLLENIKKYLNKSVFLGLACNQKFMGLVAGHAYSITGHTVVVRYGRELDLIRIRNPWGKVEWKGDWSDSDYSWDYLTPAERAHRVKQEDGEFWMSFSDMKAYFCQLHVVHSWTVKDFEKVSGNLRVERHFGSWSYSNGTAGGTMDIQSNPKYEVNVGGYGNKCQLTATLSRERSLHSKVKSGLIVCRDRLDTRAMLRDMYGRATNNEFSEIFQTFQFAVSPGKYVITPMTLESGVERKFCLRIVYQIS